VKLFSKCGSWSGECHSELTKEREEERFQVVKNHRSVVSSHFVERRKYHSELIKQFRKERKRGSKL
jgi:hypothetical protein